MRGTFSSRSRLSRTDFSIALRFVFIIVLALPGSPPAAQPAPAQRTEGVLARSVPAKVDLFINIHRLADLEHAVQQAHAGALLSLVSGQSGATASQEHWAAIRALSGLGDHVSKSDLLQCEFGIVAEDIRDAVRPVWLIAAANEEMVARWFPHHARSGEAGDAARIFRTDDGRFVCIRGRIVAIAPRTSDWVRLGSILRAMAGGEADVLENSAAYRKSIAYLPTRSLATIFLSGLGGGRARNHAGNHLVIGVYSKGETIDLAFRGTRSESSVARGLKPAAMERMLKLPATTIGAYIAAVDWSALAESAKTPHAGVLARYARLLHELGRDAETADPSPLLGNHVIVAWGQDFSPDGAMPQLALLAEARNSAETSAAVRRIVDSLIRILSTLELRNIEQELTLVERAHLGVKIQSIPLRDYSKNSRFGWVRLLAKLEPSWAVSGDWLIVTLTPDHLQQILDAQIGFLPILGDARPARLLRDAPENHRAAAYLQGVPAGATLQSWAAAWPGGGADDSLVRFWQQGSGSDRSRLGIEFIDEDELGRVDVVRVVESSPADGRLKPGDRIIGIDGRLLELVAPADDLQRWWESTEPGSSHTLRVIRDDSMIDLEIRRPLDQAGLADLFEKPVDMLRELAVICQAIPSSTFQIHNTGPDSFSALLKLRLSRSE